MINKEKLCAQAAEIGIELDETALERLDKYAEYLVEVNKSVNLTRITEPEDIAVKHFLDSMTLLTAYEVPQNAAVADVGTGAGFPGMVLKICRPDIDLTLIDSLGKRLDFLDKLCDLLSLPCETVHLRAEEAGRNPAHREQYDLVTARAVAAMNVLTEYCVPLVKTGGAFVAMKGPSGEEETAAAQNAISLTGGRLKEIKKLTLPDESERQLIIVEKAALTPEKYPRHGGKIAKQAL